MSKKINKQIMDDFQKTYHMEYDKEKIYQNIYHQEIKDVSMNTIMKLKRLCIGLTVVIIILLISLASSVVISTNKFYSYKSNNNDIITEEFEDFMTEYTDRKVINMCGMVTIDKKINIYVYKAEYKMNNEEYYFYIIKNKDNKSNYSLITSDDKIPLNNNEYGILCIVDNNQENKDISFSVDKNGVIIDYKIG